METNSKLYPVLETKDLREMILRTATSYGDRPAFLVKDEKGGKYREISYGQFQKDINALGTKLLDMGLKGKKVAIIGENCYQWFVAYYAVVNGLGVAVPLDKELNKQEVQNLISLAVCDGVFHTDSYKDYFDENDNRYHIQMNLYQQKTPKTAKTFYFEDLLEEGYELAGQGKEDFASLELDPYEMRMILFTSGTTGKAKGVMLCHNNIVSNILDGSRIVKVFPEDRTLSILPIHHTFESTMSTGLIFYAGGSIAICEGLKYIAKNMEESHASILVGVPLIFESIYDKIWKQAEKTGKAKSLRKVIALNKKLKKFGIKGDKIFFKSIYKKFGGNLRMIVSGAAPIDPNVVRGFEDLGIRALQGYGLTETSPLLTGTPDFSNTYVMAASVGPCVASGEIKIINEADDGVGEIIFKGPNVMLGYYNMPEETAKVLKDGWFHTGDLGYLDENSWLYIAGRKKNVIVTKTGKNIYPEEVEYYINKNKYISESLVYGVDEEEKDTMVGAQIRPDYDIIYDEFGENLDEKQLYDVIKKAISDINDKLPIYKRIRNFSVRRDEFIKTTTQKIIRHKN